MERKTSAKKDNSKKKSQTPNRSSSVSSVESYDSELFDQMINDNEQFIKDLEDDVEEEDDGDADADSYPKSNSSG